MGAVTGISSMATRQILAELESQLSAPPAKLEAQRIEGFVPLISSRSPIERRNSMPKSDI